MSLSLARGPNSWGWLETPRRCQALQRRQWRRYATGNVTTSSLRASTHHTRRAHAQRTKRGHGDSRADGEDKTPNTERQGPRARINEETRSANKTMCVTSLSEFNSNSLNPEDDTLDYSKEDKDTRTTQYKNKERNDCVIEEKGCDLHQSLFPCVVNTTRHGSRDGEAVAVGTNLATRCPDLPASRP